MFSWCENTEEAEEGHLCVFACVSAARRCAWTSSHRTSSCTRKVAPLNASAGGHAGVRSFRKLSHSRRCGRCAASSSPCWTLWEGQVWRVRVLTWHGNREWRFREGAAVKTDSPATWLFTVGASTRHPAQSLALLTQLILIVHHSDAEVGQITCV